MPLRSPLSPLEAEILDALWRGGKGTANEIGFLLARDPPLKDSTVRTVLTRLEEKGYVRHKTIGRTFQYSGVDGPRTVAARAVRSIIDRFCQGSLESLLTGLVAENVVGPKELRRIAARVAGMSQPKKKTRKTKENPPR